MPLLQSNFMFDVFFSCTVLKQPGEERALVVKREPPGVFM